MKIAIVSSGNSIHVKKIANYLVKIGNDVTLITSKNHTKLLSDFDAKVKIHILPFSSPIGYYLNYPILKRILKKGNFDLINSHYASGYGTLARLTNCHPLSLAIFGSDVYEFPYKSKGNMKLVIKNLRNADVITSTSNVMANEVKKFYDEKPIYVTPFGVDLSRFKPLKVKKDDTFIFGIVKKIEYKYGIDILIKAFKIFNDKYPDAKAKVIIYGRGSAQKEFEKLAADLNIAKYVKFEGFISNEQVPKAFCKMDVACFPSRLDSESFGVAAVEAMACGAPLIVSDASGFTEVVEKNVTGFIVPKNNIEEFASAMEKMYLMSSKDRKAMGNNGIKRVKKLYNFENNMEEYATAIMHAFKK